MVSLFGIIFSCVLCIIQTDIKALVAYSRVVHINFIVLYIITGSRNKIIRIILIISHAFVSRVLFLCVGLLFYSMGTRKFYFIRSTPKTSLFIVLFILFFIINFNPPPTLGVISEFFMFFTLLKIKKVLFMVLLFFGVLASFFCIYIINNNNTGKMGQYFINITLANQIPVILLGIINFFFILILLVI